MNTSIPKHWLYWWEDVMWWEGLHLQHFVIDTAWWRYIGHDDICTFEYAQSESGPRCICGHPELSSF